MDMISQKMADRLRQAAFDALSERTTRLVILRRVRVPATIEDCELCGGLYPAAVAPGLSGTLSPDTVAEAINAHDHHRSGDEEVFSVPAHVETEGERLRVVPDVDQAWSNEVPGFYQIAVVDRGQELGRVDLMTMPAGSILSTLTLTVGVTE